MSSSQATSTPGPNPNFDRVSFLKYIKNIGRAYRKQAMELISVCRLFVQAQEQSPRSDIELRRALQAVDRALKCAAETKGKTSREADKGFQDATDLLHKYEQKWHCKLEGNNLTVSQESDNLPVKLVSERMKDAKLKDKSSLTILFKLKVRFHLKTHDDESPGPTRIVRFLLCESPIDTNPTVVHQELTKRSDVKEILWNFSRFKDKKRLALIQNPHFYKDLPTSPEAYGSRFQADPIEDFHNVDEVRVLTDKPGRLYLDTPWNTRAFGNIWIPKHAIIFKDSCGKLEGEKLIEEYIYATPNVTPNSSLNSTPNSTPNITIPPNTTPEVWHRKEHPLPSLRMIKAPPINSATGGNIPVWKQVIRLTAKDRDIDILISTKPQQLEDGWILYSSPYSNPSAPPSPQLSIGPRLFPPARPPPDSEQRSRTISVSTTGTSVLQIDVVVRQPGRKMIPSPLV